MGDSYTAVAGDGPYRDSSCYRAFDNYPSLLAEKENLVGFTDASCGGADSEDLENTQYLPSGGANPPQLEAVTRQTKLVTLGMGINDNDLGTIVTLSCYSLTNKVSETCRAYLDRPESELDDLVKKMGTGITKNLAAIRAAAPDARIVLIGYPRSLPDKGVCDSELPLPGQAAERARRMAVAVNDELKQVAKKEQVDFVDMYEASTGHDICSDEPWVNGQQTIAGEALPFHPFEAYHVAVADKLSALLDAS
ncbi:lysophospholipase L1-like esterase [Marmoricola sp. OAE513]|uniref:SGNH/GDSL hydrolase family protein n=1 Tax=Marmoricola sp. OAE513 TaxID=2817894 RepID=UPI001AE9D880